MPKHDPLLPLKEIALARNKQKYPSMPDYARVIHNYSDKTANGLTRCWVDFLNFSGHQAERITSSGRMIDNRKTYTNVLNQNVTIGTKKWIPGTGRNGTADISSTIQVTIAGHNVGLSVKWEVKMKDKQSDDQKSYEVEVKQAGGHYYIIHSFEEALGYYRQLLKNYE